MTFHQLATTTFGEDVYIVGGIPQLGNWATSNAVALSATQYTSFNPLWSVTIELPVGASFQYSTLTRLYLLVVACLLTSISRIRQERDRWKFHLGE